MLTPIGTVKNSVKNRKDSSWGDDVSLIILDEQYAGGLKVLRNFLMQSFFSIWIRPGMKKKDICKEGLRIVMICRWSALSLKGEKTDPTE